MKNRFRSLLYGLSLPLTALRTIGSHPVLIFWSVLPTTITLALYVFLIVRMQTATQAYLLHEFAAWGWSPSGWGAWIALILLRLLILLAGVLTFSFVSGIAASPFNDFLAEKTERFAHPPLSSPSRKSLKEKLALIGMDLLRTLAATVAALAAIALSWVPVVGILAFCLAFLLMAFQYISYPQTRRGQGIRAGLWFLWKHSYACLGFGAALSVLFAIPIVSSLSIPLAVVGGTLLVARANGEPRLR